MNSTARADALARQLDDVQALLSEYRPIQGELVSSDPLPSLLEECQALCAEFAAPEPIRSLHHFACTGGTLLSKCIATLPNLVLLSEIDPLSRMTMTAPDQKPAFAPTDIFLPLLQSLHGVSERVIVEIFQAAMGAARDGLARHGQRLVLRDHAHSHFCTAVDPDERPTLHEILRETGPVLSLVTIRHPLDSFVSLDKNRWRHFQPFTLDAYSSRYLKFLDRYDGISSLKYEDFVLNPEIELQRACAVLDVPFTPLALDLIKAMPLSGDSGRGGAVIAPRDRRPVPEEIDRQRGAPHYTNLCLRLGYEP